ncbi:MAG TPA: hypothetical protein VFQ53_20660 [Kofleriaceae bacterium]|nr:hypothetical protein [Kofleriaceae bacterium]
MAINRIAVPMLRPTSGPPPVWHTALDYVGLFVFYFTGALAMLVILARSVSALDAGRGLRDAIAHVVLGITALLSAFPLFVSVPPWTTVALAITFAVAVLAVAATVFGKHRDLGVQLGLPVLVVPLLLHSATVIGAEFLWAENTFDGPVQTVLQAGVWSLAAAAILSPYLFAPRPFATSVTRPIPVIVAMSLAAVGALVARLWYGKVAKAAELAIGIEMSPTHADQRLALYLLAVATLGWTITSCALAATESRRTIGAGIGLVLLGGYAFVWPQHYLLPLLGVALIADAARRVRDEELEAMPYVAHAPPVPDGTWSTYIGMITQGLRRTLADVHSLTTRGDGGLASSIIVGEVKGVPVRARIERVDGKVLAIDVVIGREIDELRGATLTVWAVPERGLGTNPAAPPAGPLIKSGDARFDERFRVRGNAAAFATLFDDGRRERALTYLAGWLAYWEREGVRYRVYPGRGAPLDHPLPLSDLAHGKVPPNAEEIIASIELLVELGTQVLEPPAPVGVPSDLEVS